MVFLIVDDSPRMRESFKRMIARRAPNNHRVYEAADGSEAIRLYNEVLPDWVLMDIKMEPMDGLEASRAILAAHPDAKIIILTNYDDAGYRRAAREAGVRDYLLKERLNKLPSIILGDAA